ncbi:MAG TPA: hypothetical protein VJP02_26970 [Candidatus Sulfotelmatobacter sp.]|nr:hypothetical protein [Candidatus Sulfotelmatobacter sp.]
MSEREYKEMIVPCKVCAKEFRLHMPMHIYEMMVAAAEEDGEKLEFTGTCPSCRQCDPFLRMLDEADIPTIGRDFTKDL